MSISEQKSPTVIEEYASDKDDPLYWQMRQENDEFLRRQYWWWRHWQNTLSMGLDNDIRWNDRLGHKKTESVCQNTSSNPGDMSG